MLGHFTRPILGKPPYRTGFNGTDVMPAIWKIPEGSSMRGIAHILVTVLPSSRQALQAPTRLNEPRRPRSNWPLFPFELEDYSAAAAYIPPLMMSTASSCGLPPRRRACLWRNPGATQLIDVGAANDPAAKAGKLRYCGGCEAKVAAGLDAEQSMLWIVTRISRTDYAVTSKSATPNPARWSTSSRPTCAPAPIRPGAAVCWLVERRLLDPANTRERSDSNRRNLERSA